MLILFPQSPLYLLVVGRKAYLCGPASTPHWEMSGLCLLSSFPSPCLSDTHARCTKRGKMAIEQELLIGKTGKWWQKRQGQMHFSVTRSNWFFFFSFTGLIYLSDQGQHTQTDYINCKPSTWLIASYALHLILHLYFKSIHFFFTQF